MARTDRQSVLSVLKEVRQLDDDLSGGLRGRGVGSAARRLGRLLDADAVVLADLDGVVARYGTLPPDTDPEALLAQVYGHGGVIRQPPLSAAPLFVADDLAGCLMVSGDIAQSEVREVAALASDHLDHAVLRVSRERIAAADLGRLRAQISPHFMHNALAAIAALIHADPERARELLSEFADYLRYSFSSEGDYATVAAELQATQTYLELQRARFRDRFDVTVRIAPEVLPVAIPFLVVQPIVENAVRHGLEPKPGGEGRISVSGFGEGPLCVIEIEDDGVGMAPEFARSVLAGTGPPSKGIGLANVDERLRKVYGAEYGLVVETAPESGTKVMIRIPRFMRGVVAE